MSLALWGILIAAASFIVSVFALVQSLNANRHLLKSNVISDSANAITKTGLELDIFEKITFARTQVEQIAISIGSNISFNKPENELTEHDRSTKEVLTKAYNSSKEAFLNSYEIACLQYHNSSLDKKNFKKLHLEEIYAIIRDDAYKKFFGTGSRFTNIVNFYNATRNE